MLSSSTEYESFLATGALLSELIIYEYFVSDSPGVGVPLSVAITLILISLLRSLLVIL